MACLQAPCNKSLIKKNDTISLYLAYCLAISHKITWFLEPGAKSLNLIEISTNFLIKLFDDQHESAEHANSSFDY